MRDSRAGTSVTIALGAGLLLFAPSGLHAQSVTDGSGALIGEEDTRAVLALVARQPRGPEARVTALRRGRAGALCGAVDLKNRMGAYTGPRGFVADPVEGLFGFLPDGPELRNPASLADFRAMERAKSLFAANCSEA